MVACSAMFMLQTLFLVIYIEGRNNRGVAKEEVVEEGMGTILPQKIPSFLVHVHRNFNNSKLVS